MFKKKRTLTYILPITIPHFFHRFFLSRIANIFQNQLTLKYAFIL